MTATPARLARTTHALLLIGLAFITVAQPLAGQAALDEPTTLVRDVNRDSVVTWMATARVPGMAMAVIEGGRVTSLETFGVLRAGAPVMPSSLFNVASLTKPVTAITTLSLVSAGRLKLDESLDPYWVDPDIRDDPRHSRLTPRLILSHQTGFPNWRWLMPDKKLGFLADPGTKLTYSGAGYDYLREALEHKFGCSLNQLADSILFQRLGMTETTYGWDTRKDTTRLAGAHDTSGVLLATRRLTMDKANAADWLVTTIGDYARFAAYVLNGAGLSTAVDSAMMTPQVRFEGKPNEAMGLGFEVMRGPPGDERILLHTGSDEGVKTMVVLLPESRRGLVLFTNGERGMDVIVRVLKSTLALKELTP